MTTYEKITSTIARAFLDRFDELDNKVVDWLIASWQKGLTEPERGFARNRYTIMAQKRAQLLKQWQKNL